LKKIILKDATKFSVEGLIDDVFTKVFIASISINNVLSEMVEVE
jgi:hypothetical protein